MEISHAANTRSEPVLWSRVWLGAVIATLAATIGTVMVYFLGVMINVIPPNYEVQPGVIINVVQVIITTIIGLVGATLFFALLARTTRRPILIFRVIATVVLLLSLAGPLPAFAAGKIATGIALELMHVVAGLIAIYVFTTYPRAR